MTSTSFSTLRISRFIEPTRSVEPNVAELRRATFVSIGYSKTFLFRQRIRAFIGSESFDAHSECKTELYYNYGVVKLNNGLLQNVQPKLPHEFNSNPILSFFT